jgi:hypothetical protein
MDTEGRDAMSARLRARERQVEEAPPLETVAWFLRGYCADAGGLEEVRAEVADSVATNPRPVARSLRALETVLAGPPPPEGTLARLVAWDANRGLKDESDAAARAWLEELAVLIGDVLDQAGAAPEQNDQNVH